MRKTDDSANITGASRIGRLPRAEETCKMLHFVHVLQAWVATRRTDEEGATAIEYGLLAALISLAIVAGATAVGLSLDGLFNAVSDALDAAI
jgi:pilus assembly protein Flp/PilA